MGTKGNLWLKGRGGCVGKWGYTEGKGKKGGGKGEMVLVVVDCVEVVGGWVEVAA